MCVIFPNKPIDRLFMSIRLPYHLNLAALKNCYFHLKFINMANTHFLRSTRQKRSNICILISLSSIHPINILPFHQKTIDVLPRLLIFKLISLDE